MKKISLLALLLFALGMLSAQESHIDSVGKRPGNRFYFTGGGGAQFGQVTFINLSPAIGYRATENFSFGGGLIYQYLRYNVADYSTNVYGPMVFSRLQVFKQVFGYSEFQYLSLKYRDASFSPSDPSIGLSLPVWFVGGGVNMAVGPGAFMGVMLLWDVLRETNSPYQRNPVVRVGVGFGL